MKMMRKRLLPKHDQSEERRLQQDLSTLETAEKRAISEVLMHQVFSQCCCCCYYFGIDGRVLEFGQVQHGGGLKDSHRSNGRASVAGHTLSDDAENCHRRHEKHQIVELGGINLHSATKSGSYTLDDLLHFLKMHFPLHQFSTRRTSA